MAEKFETESTKIGSGWNWITPRKMPNGSVYFEGEVISPNGIVDVYSQDGHTSMTFVHGGRKWRRVWKKRFSPQGLSRLAKAFAKEIAEA